MKLRTQAVLLGMAAILALAPRPAAADTRIFDIQLGLVAENTTVQIDGVVVTAVGRFGFFVQEPNSDPTYQRQWSGIWIFTNDLPTVEKGDLVNVSGVYQEYFDFSEIDETLGGAYSVVGTAAVPAPVQMRIAEVNDTGAMAENYESVLIRVDRTDATLFSRAPNPFNEWYMSTQPTIGVGDSLLFDVYSAAPGGDFEYDVPPAGTGYTFAQGILVYNFGQYKLAPRSCEGDLGGPCKPKLRGGYATAINKVNAQFGVGVDEVTAENANNYELASGFLVLAAQRDDNNHRIVHLTTENLPGGEPDQLIVNACKSEGGVNGDPNQTFNFRTGITRIEKIQKVTTPAVNDSSPLFGEIVTVEGKITALDGNYYYMQDAEGGQWDGLYSRVARGGSLAIGDKVQVTGRVNEFFGSTQINYQSGCDNWVNLGPQGAPVVNTVTAAQIKYRSATKVAEVWENQLVKIVNATVDSLTGTPGPYFREWLLRQTPDTAGCDLDGITGVSYDPCRLDRVDMTGILRYNFNQYRIAPRTGRGGDINVVFDNPACVATAVDEWNLSSLTVLGQNQPNPFQGSTQIVLRLPETSRVQLDVLDVGGRLVRRLVESDLAVGSHLVAWDGRNQDGVVVGSGTYFYRLRTDGHELSRKMMVLK